MRRRAGGVTFAREAGPRAGRGEVRRIFRFVEKNQVSGSSQIECGYSSDPAAQVGPGVRGRIE